MEFFLLTPVSMQAVWRSVLFPSQPPLQRTAGTPSSFPPTFHPLTDSFLPPRCVHLFNEHLLAFSSMPGSRLGTEKIDSEMTRSYCPGFFHKPHHLSTFKMLLALQGLSAVTSLHFNLLIHPRTRHPTWNLPLESPKLTTSWWLQRSRRQPWPRGSLSIFSNKPYPWLTLT